MAIAAKPVGASVNTGATYYPDNLWLLDEGTGTTLDDKGGGTTADMTIVGASVTWVADGTHGNILRAASGNTTSYAYADSALGATASILMVGLFRGNGSNPTAIFNPMGMASATLTGRYLTAQVATTGRWAVIADDNTNTPNTQFDSIDYHDGTVHMVAIKAQDDSLSISVDGGAWDTDLLTTTWDWASAGLGRVCLFGSIRGTVPSLQAMAPDASDGSYDAIAMWAYKDNWAAWDDAFIAGVYNSEDPWTAIGLTTAVKKLKLLAHPNAASATGVYGSVFEAPTGGALTGNKIGNFSGAAFEATLENNKAVLKVDVADFGGSALTTSSTPVAIARNTSYTTGVLPCTVIEE